MNNEKHIMQNKTANSGNLKSTGFENDYDSGPPSGIKWLNIKQEPDDRQYSEVITEHKISCIWLKTEKTEDIGNVDSMDVSSYNRAGCGREHSSPVNVKLNNSLKTLGHDKELKGGYNAINNDIKKERSDDLDDVQTDIGENKPDFKLLEMGKTEDVTSMANEVGFDSQSSEQMSTKMDTFRCEIADRNDKDRKRKLTWHQCKFCEFKTKYKSSLVKHFTIKHDENPDWFQCEFCKYRTKVKTVLREHFKKKHDSCVNWHYCEFCELKTKTKSSLSRHFMVKHSRNPEWHNCQHCDFKTKHKASFEAHLEIKHGIFCEEGELYRCQFCDYKSKFNSALRLHLVNKHNENPEWHQCLHCAFKAKRRDGLRLHMVNKHGNSAKWHHCSLCEYKSLYRNRLSKHFKNKHDDAE